ncbi:hypothetical protein AMTRI_Chr04g182880 [Amborella trichopoda]|nr:pentatricopeptide repeat-containing protein At4g01570 isoform X1 [Amborella trichopoda]XP_020528349.1 pentatricopeptide repeat-containing protein At4g01570 isoform X1 [Amborella trichopoda]XP_020528352.1 pentatricopeptide repeat-containing protein At4g01570 isoform X1 [Amborella trichopoda]XP_020528357.1 pentatricopeptide repeat-containing protein At4g01570 isoform X1 [Amborella trichopoda]|eukprot:XP_020528344.1 pentatricopeptide repeat-containing protein At4g01570 isoform X1 [Amborella trichopoda]
MLSTQWGSLQIHSRHVHLQMPFFLSSYHATLVTSFSLIPNPSFSLIQKLSFSHIPTLLLVVSICKALINGGTTELQKLPIVLSHSLVLQVLKKDLNPHRKMEFFRWVSSQTGYKPSNDAYSLMVQIVSRNKDIDSLRTLMHSMKTEKMVLDSRSFKLMLNSFVSSGNFDQALELLQDMEEIGSSLSPQIYSSVLLALIKKERVDLALTLFHSVLKGGHVLLSSVACNQLMVFLRKRGMVVEFKRVISELRNLGYQFDIWGYNICIHAFGSFGDLGFSLELFREMKEKSWNPDLCTYNTLLRILCNSSRLNDALAIAEELKNSGHDPDGYTYRILIHGCCKAYRINEALKLFREMEVNTRNTDTVVYNCMMDGLFKAGKVSEACNFFENMVQEGIRPTCWSYNILIDGLFRNGRAEAAYTLFCDLKKKGQFVDSITYSIVIWYLCKDDKTEASLELVEEMEARGLVVDLTAITTLLMGLHRTGRWDWAEKLMKHVRDSSLVPSLIRWTTEMESCLRAPQDRAKDFEPIFQFEGGEREIVNLISYDSGSEDKTQIRDEKESDIWSPSVHLDRLTDKPSALHGTRQFSLYRGVRVHGKGFESFDTDMVNTYMSVFLAKGKLSIACKLFEIFNAMGHKPVSYTYNSLVSSFVKRGYFNEAWGVLCEMRENCPADIATYNAVIQGLGKMGRVDLVCAVLDQLLQTGGYLDVFMYNTLIHVLGRGGRLDEANKLFEQMKSSGINPDVVTYNTLIEVHSKAGRVKEAYEYLKAMLDAGCPPNHITDTILDFLEREIEKLRYEKASMKRVKDGPS